MAVIQPHPKSLSLRLRVAASAKQGGGEGLKELTHTKKVRRFCAPPPRPYVVRHSEAEARERGIRGGEAIIRLQTVGFKNGTKKKRK